MSRPILPLGALARTAAAALATAAALALAACASTGVNSGDVNLVSVEEEWQLGRQLERDLAGRLRLVGDRALAGYVSAMGQRIVRQTELAGMTWEFHVVADPEVNAFNVPGGHVYVNTGLIATADNASELAAVVAHEVAHGVSRHGTEQLTRGYGLNLLAGLVLGENPAAYERLLALEAFGVKLGLTNMARLCEALDHPERSFRSVHVAGTNGKGSVTAMVHAALLAAGPKLPSGLHSR